MTTQDSLFFYFVKICNKKVILTFSEFREIIEKTFEEKLNALSDNLFKNVFTEIPIIITSDDELYNLIHMLTIEELCIFTDNKDEYAKFMENIGTFYGPEVILDFLIKKNVKVFESVDNYVDDLYKNDTFNKMIEQSEFGSDVCNGQFMIALLQKIIIEYQLNDENMQRVSDSIEILLSI